MLTQVISSHRQQLLIQEVMISTYLNQDQSFSGPIFINHIIDQWNSLLPSVIDAPSISAFKSRLLLG